MGVLVLGGVLVAAAAVVGALGLLGGSSGPKQAQSSTTSTTAHSRQASTRHHATSRKTSSTSHAANVAEQSVTVLNGTETTGLAHRVSSALQQRGYSQANALNGRPPGSGQVTVVEYASGHKAEAEGVARELSVKQVQPLESAVAALSGSAQVVVLVGSDSATP
jgi:hypothetical protein